MLGTTRTLLQKRGRIERTSQEISIVSNYILQTIFEKTRRVLCGITKINYIGHTQIPLPTSPQTSISIERPPSPKRLNVLLKHLTSLIEILFILHKMMFEQGVYENLLGRVCMGIHEFMGSSKEEWARKFIGPNG